MYSLTSFVIPCFPVGKSPKRNLWLQVDTKTEAECVVRSEVAGEHDALLCN
jgi:hypothetical protein